MKFQGAQTWMLTGLDTLWSAVDQKWQGTCNVSPTRTKALNAARSANTKFMASKAATVELLAPGSGIKGTPMTVNVKVTKLTGHKRPTGFSEGRQMWIYIKAVDAAGHVVLGDGMLDTAGKRVRTPGYQGLRIESPFG